MRPAPVRCGSSLRRLTLRSRSASRRRGSASSRPKALAPTIGRRRGRHAPVRRPAPGRSRSASATQAVTLLARNTAWWGASAKVELGPALDQIELQHHARAEPAPGAARRRRGPARRRARPPPGRSGPQRPPPERAAERVAATFLGIERSVRGVDSGREIPRSRRLAHPGERGRLGVSRRAWRSGGA